MELKKISTFILNPTLGIIPFVLFMVINYYLPYRYAFLAVTIFFTGWMTVNSMLSGSEKNTPYMLIVTGFTMVVYVIGYLIEPLRILYEDHSTIICEILLAATFLLLSAFSGLFKEKNRVKFKNKVEWTIQKAKINEFFYVVKLYQNVLILHIFTLLLYNLLPTNYHTIQSDFFFNFVLIIFFFLLVIVYEYVRLSLITRKIEQETWLPIVNETGAVVGRMASSMKNESGKLYMHPVVRIALICKGQLYLRERTEEFMIDIGKLDYPLEKFVHYNHTLDQAVNAVFKKQFGIKPETVRFAFRYVYKTKETHRLIYLYTCNLQDETTIRKMDLRGGKLWLNSQIEDNLNKGVFSECFEKEYEFLKNTVLQIPF